jgi:diaminohydroxyphosphoribosylaminopyrimidine deaminase/5-amino-6-(5-phosphoribosylamino)uracil reductase
MTPSDTTFMRRALALARKALGCTRPNPPVGALVVKGGQIIGEGYHTCAGQPHAEVEALNACRVSPQAGTLYVTLEPCCTHGRTPPCTERILNEKIARVVVGCHDENGCHCGRGLEILRKKGVEVVFGVCEDEAKELVRPFFKHVNTGYPFLTLKLAMTLDGRIADSAGASKWITGEAARKAVQQMRRGADAILVGAGTVCADNPSLLYRSKGRDNLMRVIVDATGRTPATATVLTDSAATRTIMATLSTTAQQKIASWQQQGAAVWTFSPDKNGHIPLKQLLRRLGKAGHLHVLCEGGGTLAGALHDARLIDDYALFYAPAILGDSRAISGFAGKGVQMKNLERLELRSIKRIGGDLLVRLLPRCGCE